MRLSTKNLLKLSEIKDAEMVFERDLERVLVNVKNLNTDPKTVREINMKFIIKPVDDKRELFNLDVKSDCKLAPYLGISTSFYADIDEDGNVYAAEIKRPEQISLEDFEDERSKVTNFDSYRNKFKTN